jgi:hypothetical protein
LHASLNSALATLIWYKSFMRTPIIPLCD